MSEIYDKWTSESEYLEFLRDYKVVGVPEYEFHIDRMIIILHY